MLGTCQRKHQRLALRLRYQKVTSARLLPVAYICLRHALYVKLLALPLSILSAACVLFRVGCQHFPAYTGVILVYVLVPERKESV
jgi:hypothetical protein